MTVFALRHPLSRRAEESGYAIQRNEDPPPAVHVLPPHKSHRRALV